VTSCSEGGVLGPVVGVIGSLQALETIKIAVTGKSSFAGNLWLFDGFDGKTKMISMREKMPICAICSENPKIKELQDYEKFCGSGPTDKVRCLDLLSDEERISPREYSKLSSRGNLIDVRPVTEFEICHLSNAKSFPLDELKKANVQTIMQKLSTVNDNANNTLQNGTMHGADDISTKVFVVCHRGNDSQLAMRLLRERLSSASLLDQFTLRDISGGLERWAQDVDPSFPRY